MCEHVDPYLGKFFTKHILEVTDRVVSQVLVCRYIGSFKGSVLQSAFPKLTTHIKGAFLDAVQLGENGILGVIRLLYIS